MALIMKYIDSLHHYMDKYGDPRTKDWPLMSSPFHTLGICLGYVYIVKVLGPRLMENRKPFQLKNTLVAYNLFQVLFSTWLFYEIGISGWLTGHYNFRCQPVDYSNHPSTLRMCHACWWYYFSKFTEFFDTLFFVLRKKTSQVSTLHVIHHGVMPMSVWFGVKFTPGGHSTFFGLLNTFVHIIMYTYYLLTAMGPQYQKYLWWKKYLTALQMVQFILIMVHAFQLLFVDCNYPKVFVWWIGAHAIMFFFLFKEFYRQSYNYRKLKSGKNHSNGYSNGTTKKHNGDTITNGHCNGVSKTETTQQKHQNGAANGAVNGCSVSDYYVKSEDITTNMSLTQRKVTAEQ